MFYSTIEFLSWEGFELTLIKLTESISEQIWRLVNFSSGNGVAPADLWIKKKNPATVMSANQKLKDPD